MNTPYVRNFFLLFAGIFAIVVLLVWGAPSFCKWKQPVEQFGAFGPPLPPPPPPPEALNSSTAPADWKLHTDEKYGFEIRYPKEWQIVREDPQMIFELLSPSTMEQREEGNYWPVADIGFQVLDVPSLDKFDEILD